FFVYDSGDLRPLPSFPTRRSSDLAGMINPAQEVRDVVTATANGWLVERYQQDLLTAIEALDSPVEFVKTMKLIGSVKAPLGSTRSEEHTSELQSRENLVCRPLLEK